MRKITTLILSLLLCVSVNSYAKGESDHTGLYGGIGVGYAIGNLKNGPAGSNMFNGHTILSVTTIQYNGGVSGRIFVGYHFLNWLGIELGYQKFSPLDWTIVTVLQNAPTSIIKMKVNASALDLLVTNRIGLGFHHLFALLKYGVAYVNTKTELSSGFTIYNDSFRPEIGAGIGYHLSNCVNLLVTYSHIFNKSNLHAEHHTPAYDSVLFNVEFTV